MHQTLKCLERVIIIILNFSSSPFGLKRSTSISSRKSRERMMTTPTEVIICHMYKDCLFFFNSTESYHFCLERFRKELDASSGESDKNRGQNTSWF